MDRSTIRRGWDKGDRLVNYENGRGVGMGSFAITDGSRCTVAFEKFEVIFSLWHGRFSG